ncbi:helix-turn-helix transcriptional regulator [Streptomyces sp. CB02923]|uniref:helix-turn-helix transcriptional regulator n=1 Tax=Streptomyces sp. CB02923 TaxID=1718985 RepID=UPI000AB542C6|nr:LuxR family transcriptional regulator [Streptomyces sp. CB02923]
MKLVERDTELSVLEGALDACAAGRGGVVVVSGAVAGGKTALLRAFRERAAPTGALWLQATAAAAEKGMPLRVAGQLLRTAELAGAGAEPVVWLPPAAGGGGAPVRAAGDTIPAEVAVNVFPRVCGILFAQARKRPVVVCIDDVHQADAYSLECVLYVVRRLDVSRILVVLGESSGSEWEDSPARQELLRRPGCRFLRVGPLPRDGVVAMLAAGQKGRRSAPPVSEFHRLSGGSPLLMRALLDDYADAERAGSAELVPGEAYERAVALCLSRSDVLTRRAAWLLAVLGERAARVEPAEVLGVSRPEGERSLRALHDMGLLAAGRFRHEAGRTAVLRRAAPPRSAGLEARVAQVLYEHGAPAGVLARHLLAAGTADAPWALPVLLEAAEAALARDEVGFALDCLRVAGNSCADERQALKVRVALVRAGWRVDPSAAVRHLPALTDAARDGRLTSRDMKALAGHLLWYGRADDALEVLRGVEPEEGATRAGAGGGAGPGLDPARVWFAYGYPGLAGKYRAEAAAGPYRSAAAGARGPGLTPEQDTQQRALALMASVLDQGGAGDVIGRAERILHETRPEDRTPAAGLAALVALVVADGLREAARWCDILLAEAREHRTPMWQALFASAKAFIEIRLGELAAAEESAHTALTVVPPEGWGVAVAAPVAALLYAKAAMGRLDEAAAHLEVPVPDAAFRTPGGLLYLWARGHYHLAAGRPYVALEDFHRCGDLMAGWHLDLSALVPWRTDAAQVHVSLGDDRRARALLEEELTRTGFRPLWTRGVALRVLAALAERADRPRLLGEAMDILQRSGHRLELAYAMAELSYSYWDINDDGRARVAARKAQQLMRECGIKAPVLKASPVGAARACPPERSGACGAGQSAELSGAELRVATLAARGYTNRQIAGSLFITISTVEQHLTRAYRKLGVQRRTDLATRLGPDAEAGAGLEGCGDGAQRDCLRVG